MPTQSPSPSTTPALSLGVETAVPASRAALARPGTQELAVLGIAVLAVSTSGPLIAAAAAPAMAIALWRNAMACAVLVPAVAVVPTWRAEVRGLRRRELGLVLAAGVLLAAHFAAWTSGVRLTSVSTATALVATQPIWSAVIAKVVGEHVARSTWLGIAVAVLGAAMLTGLDLRLDGRAVAGDLLAALGGALAAGYLQVGSLVRRTVSTMVYTTLCYSTCAVILLIICVITRADLTGYSGRTWLALIGLTLGAQFLGHSLFNRLVKTVSPTTLSLAILLEVPGATIIAAIFLGQTPSVWAIPAAVVVLAGIAVVIRGISPASA